MAGSIQSAVQRPPRISMDVTTSLRNAGQHANGTLRVERELARGLRDEFGAGLSFCRYLTAERRFTSAEFDPAASSETLRASSKPASIGATRRDTLGRRLERSVRLAMRRAVRVIRAKLEGAQDATLLFPDAQAGDVLLLGGETWSERYDFGVLRRVRREGGVRIVAICQDLIPQTHPHFFAPGDFVARHRAYVDWLMSDVDLIVVHSKAVQDDLVAQAGNRNVKMPTVAVVPLGADLEKAAPSQPVTDPPLQPDGFVIAVSTIQSRKNFDLLYRVWRRFAEDGRQDMPLIVIVGARGFGGENLLSQIACDPLVKDRVLVLHDAGDAELAWLYRHCRFTLYPSFAEGWGIPISESLSYGKPCLASDTTSMPEAGAGLAVHLDPLDFEAWHDTILAWSGDPALCEAMARSIADSYRPTTWRQSAAALADALRAQID